MQSLSSWWTRDAGRKLTTQGSKTSTCPLKTPKSPVSKAIFALNTELNWRLFFDISSPFLARFQGNTQSLTPPKHLVHFTGSISNYLRETVITHPDRAKPERSWNFPCAVIVEEVTNAVYHRSYAKRHLSRCDHTSFDSLCSAGMSAGCLFTGNRRKFATRIAEYRSLSNAGFLVPCGGFNRMRNS